MIVSDIRRLGERTGKSPGVAAFAQETGIAEHEWRGVFRARWSDALAEAGYSPNELQGKYDSNAVLIKVADAALQLGHVPTVSEMKILRLADETFPSSKTVTSHFGNKSALYAHLRSLVEQNDAYRALVEMLPDAKHQTALTQSRSKVDGWVYLLRSGTSYKIGRSDTLERRIKEISIALPEAVTLVHAIQTDDPPGIEGYWHRRFADLRLNGEWFRLGSSELAAFKRRKFQ